MKRVGNLIATATTLLCIGTNALAETYTLVEDFGVQGAHRRCKYSNGKVYALPKSSQSCFPSIEGQEKASDAPSNPSNHSDAAPSTGGWWHAIGVGQCYNNTTPAQVFAGMKRLGQNPQVVTQEDAVVVGDPASTRTVITFFPSKKACEQSLPIQVPAPSQQPNVVKLPACNSQLLAYGERLRGSVQGYKSDCEMHATCFNCVAYYSWLTTVLAWDAQHPRCGTPLGGGKLLLSTVQRQLKSLGCRY